LPIDSSQVVDNLLKEEKSKAKMMCTKRCFVVCDNFKKQEGASTIVGACRRHW
jgi:hypothetical protein